MFWISIPQLARHEVDDLEALRRINAIEHYVKTARAAIAHAVRDNGKTWQEIGDALGTTRQAAQERFGG